MNPGIANAMSGTRLASSPLTLDIATIDRFLGHSHRRRYPTRTDVFRPGDAAGTLYYVISGSVSIIAEEDEERELVLGYYGTGEFVGEMGLFIESDKRGSSCAPARRASWPKSATSACTSCSSASCQPMHPSCCTRLARRFPGACCTPAARPAAWPSST